MRASIRPARLLPNGPFRDRLWGAELESDGAWTTIGKTCDVASAGQLPLSRDVGQGDDSRSKATGHRLKPVDGGRKLLVRDSGTLETRAVSGLNQAVWWV